LAGVRVPVFGLVSCYGSLVYLDVTSGYLEY